MELGMDAIGPNLWVQHPDGSRDGHIDCPTYLDAIYTHSMGEWNPSTGVVHDLVESLWLSTGPDGLTRWESLLELPQQKDTITHQMIDLLQHSTDLREALHQSPPTPTSSYHLLKAVALACSVHNTLAASIPNKAAMHRHMYTEAMTPPNATQGKAYQTGLLAACIAVGPYLHDSVQALMADKQNMHSFLEWFFTFEREPTPIPPDSNELLLTPGNANPPHLLVPPPAMEATNVAFSHLYGDRSHLR